MKESMCSRWHLRLIVLLILFFPLTLSAAQGRVTVKGQSITLRQAIKIIESSSNFKFFFNPSDLDALPGKNLDCEGEISDVLKEVFAGSGISYVIMGDDIILKLEKKAASTQQKKVEIVGGVVDARSGESVVGATVRVKDVNSGVITDMDGKFTIKATPGDVLVISYIGYETKEVKVVNTRNTDAEYLYGELEKRGIPAVIMEPLLGGRLSNVHDHIAAHLKQRRPSSSVASWAFRFAGSFPGVLTVLSGMTYMEHLQDNLRTYSPFDELTDDDKEFLEQTAQLMLRYPTIPCNDCKYCMPCPYGLDIPAILLHYNKCVNEGNVATSSQDENYRRARRAFLVGYDRSVPKLRQASHCIGCNQCVPHCPQNIRIPQELHRIDLFAEHLKQDNL